MRTLTVVEICAGAGGQALGLERAGFTHELAIELDPMAAATLRANRDWEVITGDVADPKVWQNAHDKKLARPESFDLLAGGVPCPPFSIAGKQLGANDERDLFAWAVEQCAQLQPRALLLENVRGLSMPRFAGYRQHVLDRLGELGYVAEWRLLHASDFGVPQLRPRFVLVALRDEYAPYFSWPETTEPSRTVGETLKGLIASRGWEGAEAWAAGAADIGPTIVGGSKKHGGADLGPTRAKQAWAKLGVDAMGVADLAPAPGDVFKVGPKLTTEMVSVLQGWDPAWGWKFEGRKTSVYRQIGNAFPPPVAEAVGKSIAQALLKKGERVDRSVDTAHDPIYRVLREADDFLTLPQISRKIGMPLEPHELEEHVSLLSRDFELTVRNGKSPTAYKIGHFKAFTGQDDHARHDLFLRNRARIS